jgi:DNA-binding GntR family transcriptional regulator
MMGSGVPTQERPTVTVKMTYRQIANDLAQRIRNGEYPPGYELPSYAQLAELYSVSTATASRAYGLLHDRGLIVGSPGRGVFVADQPSDTL